ncbi:HAD superfamily hydrolase (TIGR01509 family) [Luteimonas sp. J16]|uniref:HAD family hydrolase n=1 Tax=unclassified Luteimonas TaxID=2629088 RepID=UPI00047D75F9|nr:MULTISPECIES: HAD family phosphatase [unclassified Luteimonas]TWG89755.1 HAD superfamily hydrolase (TIGR01509 family) [Luteimonas sp. J16]
MSRAAPLPFAPAAVVFDMDGLMLDSERAITDCMVRAAQEAGHALPPSLWLELVGTAEDACRERLAGLLGADAADALLARVDVLYDAVVDAGVPHRPGVVALLDWLDRHGLARAVATSTRRPLALRKLRLAGLLERFHAVCTSSDVARPKPAPDVYLLAARRLGVAPERCLVLEDSPTGVRAALAAGMLPVQVPDLLAPDEEVRALGHRIVASLDEVRGLLEAVVAERRGDGACARD